MQRAVLRWSSHWAAAGGFPKAQGAGMATSSSNTERVKRGESKEDIEMGGQEDHKDAECFRHYFQAKSDARGLS